MAHEQLPVASWFQKVAAKKRIEVVTAVCKISRNRGWNKESVGQGCLVQTKQSNECCVVTTDKVIPHNTLDTCRVEFTKKDSKPKLFSLKDITKEVKYDSGLVKIVIDLKSSKLKHGKNICSIFTESPLTITALEESKKQFCYIDRKFYNLQVKNDSTIEFPDVPPSAICDGLIILQTSNSTDDDVTAVGIQSQVDGNQKMIILDSSTALSTAPDPPSIEAPNPSTAFNRVPANGDGQQSLAGATAGAAAAADQAGNEPQNPVLNSETAAGDVTDVSHTSSTNNEDAADPTATATGDAGHNSQRTDGGSSLGQINGGFSGRTNGPIQEESEQSATDGASDQQDGTVRENFEHYRVSDKIKENRGLQNMLASHLDRASQYGMTTWEDLASTEEIGAPLDILRKCKLSGQRSCTLVLFELLASDVTYRDKKVRELIEALHVIHQEAKGLIEESLAYKRGKENFLNKKISEFVDDVESTLIDAMATCLDQTSLYERTPFWRLLATKLGVPKEKVDEIQHCEVNSINSTKALMAYYYSAKGKITIEQFCELVETKLKRDDVLKILKPIAKKASGEKLPDVLTLESDEMTNICVLLNKPKSGNYNWEKLAEILCIATETYQQFRPAIPESPTKILLEWIFYRKEKLTVGQLISALISINRHDVVEKLRKHFLPHSTTN